MLHPDVIGTVNGAALVDVSIVVFLAPLCVNVFVPDLGLFIYPAIDLVNVNNSHATEVHEFEERAAAARVDWNGLEIFVPM